MKPAAFAYVRPDSLAELCEQLARYGEDGRILAGGQSLGAMLNMRLVTPQVLLDINRIAGLNGISEQGTRLVTGATLPQADALASALIAERVPLLAAALPHVGHWQTRSRGTLAGSVAHADPSAEIPLALFTLGGEIELRSTRGTRKLPAREFFRAALSTARAADEAIVALHWPVAASGARYLFRELAMRAGDYAVVAGACYLQRDSAGRIGALSLAFGACADRPQLVDCSAFQQAQLNEESIAALADAAGSQVECKHDLHASAAYRRNLVRVFTREMLREAAQTKETA